MPPSPPASPPSLPYKDHPLYYFRYATILDSLIGFVLCLFGFSSYEEFILFCLVANGLSVALSYCDLTSYAIQVVQARLTLPTSAVNNQSEGRGGDDEPGTKIPSRRILIFDFCLAVLHLWLFLIVFASVAFMGFYYSQLAKVMVSYAALTHLIDSGLHAYCYWKELMARYRARWIRTLPCKPCAICGSNRQATADISPLVQNADLQPSSRTRQPINTPSASSVDTSTVYDMDTAMEEGLLIDDIVESGYGTIARPEEVVEQPVGKTVKKKDRKRDAEQSGKGKEKVGMTESE